jgi:Kyakuja-Dileera-Zisupton transposase
VFANFSTLSIWYIVKSSLEQPTALGAADIVEGKWSVCPCCWEHCTAISADGCLGLRRLRRAAKRTLHLQPLNANTPFIPAEQVKEALEEQGKLDKSLLDRPACSQFKAAAVLGRRVENYDKLGVVAAVCRHEAIVGCCSMETHENFTYYTLMARLMQEQFAGRTVGMLNVDIACQLDGCLHRYTPCMTPHGFSRMRQELLIFHAQLRVSAIRPKRIWARPCMRLHGFYACLHTVALPLWHACPVSSVTLSAP